MTTREEIYEQLNEQIPFLRRRECTPRIMEATDLLLDQLIIIQREEEFDNVFGTYTTEL